MANNIDIVTVLKELYNISGFRVSLHGADFAEIAAFPPGISAFCSLVQKDKNIRERCLRCDSDAYFQAKKTGKPFIYRCDFGLCEAVAPLYHFGILSGYLMMGQVRCEESNDRLRLIAMASEYVKDKTALERAVDALPVYEQKKIAGYVNIMTICAEYITLSGKLSPPSKDFSSQIRKYINANYNKKITLDSLCKRFKCSKSTLMNTFKKECFQTVVEYITDVRLSNAVKMLEGKEDSINDIAVACGFCDQCYFSKMFSKRFGMTPSKYRASYIEKSKEKRKRG